MKIALPIFLLALGLAVASGLVYRSSLQLAIPNQSNLTLAQTLPLQFVNTRTAQGLFAVTDLPQWHNDPILVDTRGSYAESRQYCGADDDDLSHSTKGQIWYEYALCDAMESISPGFFQEPPFLHVSGQSYVGLALNLFPDSFANVEWVQERLQFMHISELSEAAQIGARLTSTEEIASDLTPQQIQSVIAQAPFVLTSKKVLIHGLGVDAPIGHHRVYPVEQWRLFLSQQPITAKPYQEGDVCLSAKDGLCWTTNSAYIAARSQWATLLAVSTLLIALLAIGLLVQSRYQSKRKEQEARLFVLQTLSHEIRTPTTSLALSLEPLRNRFDDLPEETQPAFLRICDNVQRLQRVVEASQQYLRGQLQGHNIQFNTTELDSVEDYLGSLLESYPQEISYEPQQENTRVLLDPYWVAICFRNLIENALSHGAPPVQVRVSCHQEQLRIAVSDAGDKPNLNFQQMTNAFVRDKGSQGLGLGLTVVQRLLQQMDGKLTYQHSPTCFTMLLNKTVRNPTVK